MKTILTSLFIALFTLQGVAQNNKKDQYMVYVDGLGCPFCAYGLEKKFKEFKGISDIKIDIKTGEFTFAYPSDKPLTLDQVTKQVEKAGYTPKEAAIHRANGKVEKQGGEVAASEGAKKINLTVKGNCGMCKARIEQAALKVPNVQTAVWNVDTKKLEVTSSKPVTTKQVGDAVAGVGHDNDQAKAKDKTYKNLPPCCLYKN